MTQHDQARFGDFGGPVEPWHDQPTRVSVLAVSSLVTGIVSFVGCCVPALGALPVLLGVIAIVVIQKARGALSGRAMAITGLVLGLLALAISTFFWYGATSGANRFGPLYSQAFSADPGVVRSVLDSDAAAQITDERIAEFQSRMSADLGGAPTIPQGLGPLIEAFGGVDQGDAERVEESAGSNVVPVPGATAQGRVLLVFELSQDEAMGGFFPRIADAGYVAPDGSLVWLVQGVAPAQNASPAPTPTDETTDPSAPDPGG